MADCSAERESETDELSQQVKRAKTESENGREAEREFDCRHVLTGFKTSSVLNDSAREKVIFVHGKVLFR